MREAARLLVLERGPRREALAAAAPALRNGDVRSARGATTPTHLFFICYCIYEVCTQRRVPDEKPLRSASEAALRALAVPPGVRTMTDGGGHENSRLCMSGLRWCGPFNFKPENSRRGFCQSTSLPVYQLLLLLYFTLDTLDHCFS